MSLTTPSSGTERDRLARIAESVAQITRHEELYHWLQGDIQRFIPHQVLICAYGHFDTCQLKLDVISSLPGVRSQLLAHCRVDGLLQRLFERWCANRRRPFMIHSTRSVGLADCACECPLHDALRRTGEVLVHGVRDERGDWDCLYVALNLHPATRAVFDERAAMAPPWLIDSVIGLIDICARRFPSLPGAVAKPPVFAVGAPFSLTEREHEILEWICKGKTNMEIGSILNISCFTVKNHVQRIFQKVGAGNRVQAVTIY
jgi:transcriptional regulator EpsA